MRGQPVVAMDPHDIPRGKTSHFMDKFRRWTMDALWVFGLWRFWWSSFTDQVDELPAWILVRIWTIRQLGQRLEAKGSCGNIHGWFKDGDFGWDPHVSTIDIKICYSLHEDERWPTSETKRFTRPAPLVRATLALPPANRATAIAPVALVLQLSWEEMQRRHLQGLCFNCNERFTVGHKCQGP